MTTSKSITLPSGRILSPTEIDEIGAKLDALRDEAKRELGERDAQYIRRMIRIQRGLLITGRGLLFASVFPPAWALGTFILGIAKILENMEIGHNVMHGQYDFMRDPSLAGRKYDWDTACPGDQWRHSHNYMHHTFTNIVGKDRDVGYGVLRMSEEQSWHPRYLFQLVYALILAVLFEWGVALHDLETEKVQRGEKSIAQLKKELVPVLKKGGAQILKDYVLFPLLAGPFFLQVLAGNAIANLMRNLWAFAIIFCGHFTEEVMMFTEDEAADESRGGWYVRQMLGSSNLTGGKVFHVLTGNLSHQIEHHLFPDIPAHRYAELAVEVRALADRYGLPYNTGSFSRQFGTVIARIARMSLPTPKARTPLSAHA
jgi:fatty acid desaturase